MLRPAGWSVRQPPRVRRLRICATNRNPKSLDEFGSTKAMALRLIQFLAIMLTALALVPSGAHLAALPNKMAMEQADYFAAQKIYAGWALFGIVLFGALAANLAHAIVLRKLGQSFGYALLSFVHCCEPCHLLRLDLSDKSSDQQLDRCV
jgi:hypothetical protein